MVLFEAPVVFGGKWASGTLGMDGGITRMNRWREGHTGAHEVRWCSHDKDKVAVDATSTSRVNGTGVRVDLLLQGLEARVAGGASDGAEDRMGKCQLGRRSCGGGAHGCGRYVGLRRYIGQRDTLALL